MDGPRQNLFRVAMFSMWRTERRALHQVHPISPFIQKQCSASFQFCKSCTILQSKDLTGNSEALWFTGNPQHDHVKDLKEQHSKIFQMQVCKLKWASKLRYLTSLSRPPSETNFKTMTTSHGECHAKPGFRGFCLRRLRRESSGLCGLWHCLGRSNWKAVMLPTTPWARLSCLHPRSEQLHHAWENAVEKTLHQFQRFLSSLLACRNKEEQRMTNHPTVPWLVIGWKFRGQQCSNKMQ